MLGTGSQGALTTLRDQADTGFYFVVMEDGMPKKATAPAISTRVTTKTPDIFLPGDDTPLHQFARPPSYRIDAVKRIELKPFRPKGYRRAKKGPEL